MSSKSIFANCLFLVCLSLGILSCGSKKPVTMVFQETESLAEVSEMGYFAPFFHFASTNISSYTPLRHVEYTNIVVDSILNSHYKYRITGKVENNTGGLPLVEEMSALFEQFKTGEFPEDIPPIIHAELQKQPYRYAIAFYFEPEFVHWKSGPRIPFYRPKDDLVLNENRVHALLFDKMDSTILFYGQTTGDTMKHYIWNLKNCFKDLYTGMFPDFN